MGDLKVGIIGVGLMGHGIAKNVVSKGWALGFLDHPGNQPCEDLIGLGAAKFADKHDLAAASDVIILCVSGTPQVEDVLLGENGILKRVTQGTVIIDCSTAIPSSTEAIAKQAAGAGALFMDAPMTRTPLEAEAGRLNLLVGAEPELFTRIRPLLETFAENIFHAGGASAGHKLKLLHNFCSLGMVTLLGEAAACAKQGGISAEVFTEVLAKGGGYGAAFERVSPFLLEGDNSKMKFFISNAQKDLGYYVQMAEDISAGHQTASGVNNALQTLVDGGFSSGFLSETARYFGEVSAKL
ncbi:NAD(P)-dependent oxidoreductase [Brucella thiophenivorans]|uniref:NADP oxidoreductase coenzyme F420-dependent family protein n=1 Tax=Brucella thiophenivorans TaxID=571255 RepID=A0A256FBJ7_9HYPH|nr:NAD(P)-dependent oxidoreductase [Brucella thiophenivorans]OYR12259.1 NADP oxidoreductase coenzyme F420-dependent family protein [Brucella thiophenivorans]